MKDLPKSDSGYYCAPSYDALIESFEHEVVLQIDDSDYQGDTRVLLRDGHRYGILIFGWGSCSGCDALQACDSPEEATELRDELYRSIRWGTREETLDYLRTHDWQGDWHWHQEETREFVSKAKDILA